MLLHWYGIRASTWASQGRAWCEAEVYSLPEPAYQALARDLVARAPAATVERSPSDGITLVGPVQRPGEPVDLAVWNAMLAESSVANGCVKLRLIVEGPVRSGSGGRSNTVQTFVLCGTTTSGMLLLKALWPVGHHEFVQRLYQFTAWTWEKKLLDVLEIYLAQCVNGPPALAATASWRAMGKGRRGLFSGRWDEQKVVWIARVLAEMPDDKSIAGFVRRVITPLPFAAAAVAIPLGLNAPVPVMTAGLIAAAISLFFAARIVWRKAASIWRHRRNRRATQAKLCAKSQQYRQVDASGDTTPTLRKASAELEALGAKHVCDFDADVGDIIALQASRIYALDDATISIGVLRKAGSFTFFPPKAVITLSTRFADGRRHFTTTAELYERQRLPSITGRWLPENGNLYDLVELHRRHVGRLLAQGAVPVPPPKTAAQVFDEMRRDDEEGRRVCQRSPFSWGDAFRFAFKIYPREYLAD
jgi:hypothetical protein